jgi:hypothetical protein
VKQQAFEQLAVLLSIAVIMQGSGKDGIPDPFKKIELIRCHVLRRHKALIILSSFFRQQFE